MLQQLVRVHAFTVSIVKDAIFKLSPLQLFIELCTRFIYFILSTTVTSSIYTHICINLITLPDDGKLDTESDSGEFWVLFGGFAPIGKKVTSEDDVIPETTPAKLYW